MAHQHRLTRVIERANAAQHQVPQRDLRHRSRRQGEAAGGSAKIEENLHPFGALRRISDNEGPVRRRIEGER